MKLRCDDRRFLVMAACTLAIVTVCCIVLMLAVALVFPPQACT